MPAAASCTATFKSNSAANGAGANLSGYCSATITDSTFDSNTGTYGGAMYISYGSEAEVTTSDFSTTSDDVRKDTTTYTYGTNASFTCDEDSSSGY